MLALDFAQLTNPGRVRAHNEDFIGCVQPATADEVRRRGWLFVIADGVGGEQFGEVASRTAVESLVGNFRNRNSAEPHTALLRRLVQSANHDVYEAGRAASPGGTAMSTTVVACAVRYDRAVVAHVGDSRCYLVRQGSVTPLTRDHTVVAEQARLGILSEKEAAESERRHVLSRSLGSDLFVNVEVTDHLLVPGDVLLLCSDGLHNGITAEDIARIVRAGELEAIARELLDLALERDGGDNISLQVIRIRAVERMGMYRGRPYKLR